LLEISNGVNKMDRWRT